MKTNIKIFIINIFLAGFMPQLLQAQSTMQGTVVGGNGEPLSNVNVLLLYSTDSALVKGIVSDSAGSFLFADIPPGKYLLSFTFVGFKQVYTAPYSINSNQDNILIGEVRLQEESIQLNKVTVTAKKNLFEQKTDRLVINVRNSITAASTTALDVLERSPGVIVDRQNNALSMGGKDGVVVMINGKESNMPISAVVQMLAGMPAANIERIELITTPPANFSAEGNAGIINIVMIENNNFGTNGSFSVTAGGAKSKLASSAVNFNHRKGRINLYGDYSYSFTDLHQVFRSYRKVNFGSVVKELNSSSERDPIIKIFTGRLGMDVQLSSKTTIGVLASGYTNGWSMHATGQTSLVTDYQLDTLVHSRTHEIDDWKSLNANLNLYHIFKKDESISVNLDYLYFRAKNPIEYVNSYFTGSGDFLYDKEVKSSKHTPINFWVGSGDYSRKLGKNIELQTGIKLTFSGFTNDILVARSVQDTWVTDPGLSANYELNENILAGYLSVNSNLNLTMNIKIGLRFEYTNSELNTKDKQKIVDRHYGKLFPTFFISRKITDNAAINFSYSRRITRPTFNNLAPFTIFMDPNSFTTGNPALQPSFADVVTTGYSFKNYIFSISYSHEAGAIVRFQPIIDPSTNKQLSFAENLKNLKTLALTTSIPANPAKWWGMQYNVMARWQQSNSVYNKEAVKKEQKNVRISSTQNFKLPQNLSIDISGFYQSAELNGRLLRKSFGTLDVGIQKKIGEKGKLNFTITDIFNSINARSYMDLPDQDLIVRRSFQLNQRMFKLTYSGSFGNNKLKGKRNRIDSSEEERKRVE